MVIAAGMALIAKGLVQAKVTATLASRLLAGIIRAPAPTLEREAVLRLLAGMQGVRRLSNLLCPTFDPGDELVHLGLLYTANVLPEQLCVPCCSLLLCCIQAAQQRTASACSFARESRHVCVP